MIAEGIEPTLLIEELEAYATTAHQPYGKEGILFGDIDTEKATGLLAKRFRPESFYD